MTFNYEHPFVQLGRSFSRLVAEGLRDYEISAKLRRSEHTIKNHIFRLYEKLGLSSRLELLLYSLSQSEANQGSTLGPE